MKFSNKKAATPKKHKKDWFTLTKILTYVATALLFVVVGFTIWAVIHFQDTSLLMYLIPTTEALVLAIWGLYIWRGKHEYKFRMVAATIKWLKKEGVEITPEIVNTFNAE